MLICNVSKICKECLERKFIFNFKENKVTKDKRNKICIYCRELKRKIYNQSDKRKESILKYNSNNKDKIKESKKRYYERNKYLVMERTFKWKKENKDKIKEGSRKRYLKKKDEILEHNKKWNKNNSVKMRSYCHKRRLKLRETKDSETYTKEDIGFLYKSQTGLCVICRKELNENFHIDHIYPVSKGGNNTKFNIQLLCPSCNQHKSDIDPIDYMQSRGFLI